MPGIFFNSAGARWRGLIRSVRLPINLSCLLVVVSVMFGLPWATAPAYAAAAIKGNTKWAIVLCKFSDVTAEPKSPAFFRDMFTETGIGQGGLFDYWQSMSSGNINLTGSKVGGWYTMTVSLATAKNWTWPGARWQLIRACIEAGDADFYYPDYFGIIAIINANIDSGSAGQGPLTLDGKTKSYALLNLDPGAWNTTFTAHEMGHGYGLADSFDLWHATTCDAWGGPGAYCDPWDIMSALTFGGFNPTFQGAHFGMSGPGLNAGNRDMLGWIQSGRTWQSLPYTHVVPLAGLETPTASGYLVALRPVGLTQQYFTVEFRRKLFWDRNVPGDVVLVHWVDGTYPRTYLVQGNTGQGGLGAGDYFASSGENTMIGVLDIDLVNSTAMVKIGPYPNGLTSTRATLSPPPNAAGWSNADTQVTLNTTAGPAGVQSISYAANGAQRIASRTIQSASTSFTISSEGPTSVVYSATGNDGFPEFPRTLRLKLDKTAPVTTEAVGAGSAPGQYIVTLTAVDALLGSGVQGIDYMASQPVSVMGKGDGWIQLEISAPGQTDLHYWATDNAGNAEGPHNLTLKPIVNLAPSSLSFSSPAGVASLPQTVTVENIGQTTLTLGQIATDNYAFVVTSNPINPCGASLTPGSDCWIDVVFAPFVASTYVGTLFITTNTSPALTLALEGVGTTPGIGFAPPLLSFPTTLLRDTSQPLTATITNTGTAPLLITDVSTGVGTDFVIDHDNCSPKPKTLQPGDICNVQVAFRPRKDGPLTGGLTLTDNAPGGQHTLPLEGTGLAVPAVSFNPTLLAFGDQPVGTKGAPQTVVLSSTGTANLRISAVPVGGANAADFAIVGGTCQPLPSGPAVVVPPEQTCQVDVQFSPTGTGSRSASLVFSTNLPASPKQELPLSGTGTATPAVVLNPTSLLFAGWPVGSATPSPSQQITLTNNSLSAITIASVKRAGAYPDDFAITAGSDTCSGTSVPAGDICTVMVAFAPQAVGNRNATLVFATDQGSKHTVALSGTGQGPIVSIDPPVLNFGELPVGALSDVQDLTLKNTGNAALTISSVTVSGDFVYAVRCGSSLAPGSYCIIRVKFRPSAGGVRNGQLTLTTDAADSPHHVTLSGTGKAAGAVLNPSNLAFASQPVGTISAPQQVTLTSSGTAALAIYGITASGDFQVVKHTCTLNPGYQPVGTSCTIDVTYTPKTVGDSSGVLTIVSNAPDSPHTVEMSGSGEQAVPVRLLTYQEVRLAE